jgi:hypothetical protein
MMTKIIDWVKSSNHYYHIGLLVVLALVMMSIGAFEFGAKGLWTNVWQTVKFGLLTGVVIEAYQVIVSRTFDWRNSLGDLLADVIGLVLGVGVYLLLAWCSPLTAIILFIFAFLSVVWAFVYKELQYYLLMAFLGSAMLAFSLFIYA